MGLQLARLELNVTEKVPLEHHEGITSYVHEHGDVPHPGVIARTMAKLGLSRAMQEVGWVLAINNSTEAYHLVEVARGTTCELPVHKATLYSAVLTAGTDRFVFIHNHPGSAITPTQADIDLTQEIAEGSDLLGLRLEDHYIISADPNEYFSLRAHGLYEVTIDAS